MNAADAINQKLADDSVVVGVIGLGYVGLPLAQTFASGIGGNPGVRTIGFDIDPAKIDAIASNTTYLKHLGDDFVRELNETGNFEATTDFDRLAEADAVLLCVPTPLDDEREPDMSYVDATVASVATTLRPGQLVVLESTTYPGTTRERVVPALEQTGLRLGDDYLCAFSPERENPGGDLPTARIPKLVGGIDDASTKAAAALYRLAFESVVEVSSAEVAESAKLLENIYRAVNIALVNELKVLLTKMDVPVHEVIDAAATKPFGFHRFDPGPGLGGHCIPIDPFYLAWKAKQVGMPTRFIELAGEINHAMPAYVVERTKEALRAQGRSLSDASVLVLGLAYKKNVDDVRESPALEIITQLRDQGAGVSYHDPHIAKTHKMRHYDLGMASVELTQDTLVNADAVVVVTDHDAIDWAFVAQHATLIVDTRNAIRHVPEGTMLVRA